MVVQHGVAEPESRQLAGILRGKIVSGELAAGAQLPSIVRLAEEYGVATATVNKALRILKAESLVIGVAGHGTFVRQ